ncbi:hypothetical protein [Vibrio palustris]|uniref:Uncharacterized protein n=1 Tax=Vibrio palustris TaxID=1918946 RepID=A0A1R4B6U5_9VIBR|nr:hypothetical protein [Vibrio palustris]SJL84647.1 hypothetical protein VPAL9027_02639 [Vibrio palustris]
MSDRNTVPQEDSLEWMDAMEIGCVLSDYQPAVQEDASSSLQ